MALTNSKNSRGSPGITGEPEREEPGPETVLPWLPDWGRYKKLKQAKVERSRSEKGMHVVGDHKVRDYFCLRCLEVRKRDTIFDKWKWSGEE